MRHLLVATFILFSFTCLKFGDDYSRCTDTETGYTEQCVHWGSYLRCS